MQPKQWQKVVSPIHKIKTSIRPHFEKQRNPSQHVEIREEADSILYSFGLNDQWQKEVQHSTNKSEAYFVKRINPMYKWTSLCHCGVLLCVTIIA